MRFLDRIDLTTLLVVAFFLGLAPFRPEPHLVEKARMLIQGDFYRPIDVFDLVVHGLPVLFLGGKLLRMHRKRR